MSDGDDENCSDAVFVWFKINNLITNEPIDVRRPLRDVIRNSRQHSHIPRDFWGCNLSMDSHLREAADNPGKSSVGRHPDREWNMWPNVANSHRVKYD